MPNALITLFDKTGIEKLAVPLHEMGWTIYGSEGTARYLNEHGIPAIDIATVIGAGPSKGHLVVTLSREVALGLLTPDTPEERTALEAEGIPFIDLYCSSYYPLLEVTAKEDATLDEVNQNTDIGGPNNARAAGKGGRWVIIDSADYAAVAVILKRRVPFEITRLKHLLIAKMFAANAQYDLSNAVFRSNGDYNGSVVEGKPEPLPFALGHPVLTHISPRALLRRPPDATAK